jgi:hypothetical protein
MASNLLRNSRKLFEMMGFRGINVTSEVDSAVSMRPQHPYKNFNIIIFHQKGSFQHKTMTEKFGVSIHKGLNETAESFMSPQKPSQNEYWLSIPLKGLYSKNKYIL